MFHHPLLSLLPLHTSMPPTQPTPTNSANLRYRTPLQQLVTLAKTQQFYWFLAMFSQCYFSFLVPLQGFESSFFFEILPVFIIINYIDVFDCY